MVFKYLPKIYENLTWRKKFWCSQVCRCWCPGLKRNSNQLGVIENWLFISSRLVLMIPGQDSTCLISALKSCLLLGQHCCDHFKYVQQPSITHPAFFKEIVFWWEIESEKTFCRRPSPANVVFCFTQKALSVLLLALNLLKMEYPLSAQPSPLQCTAAIEWRKVSPEFQATKI